MKPGLLLSLLFVVSASAATAEDLTTKMIMALDVNPGAVAFWAGGNDPAEGESAFATEARWVAAVKGAQAMQAKGRLLQSATGAAIVMRVSRCWRKKNQPAPPPRRQFRN